MAVTSLRMTERTADTVVLTLADQYGAVVPLSRLTAATLTLWDVETYEPAASPVSGIINNRDAEDVLASPDFTWAEAGTHVWHVQPEDTGDPANLTAEQLRYRRRRQIWRHRATLLVAFLDSATPPATEQARIEFEIVVTNSRAVS